MNWWINEYQSMFIRLDCITIIAKGNTNQPKANVFIIYIFILQQIKQMLYLSISPIILHVSISHCIWNHNIHNSTFRTTKFLYPLCWLQSSYISIAVPLWSLIHIKYNSCCIEANPDCVRLETLSRCVGFASMERFNLLTSYKFRR